MHFTLLFRWAVSLALSVALFSCGDHPLLPVSGERFRLKKTVLTTQQGAVTTTYNYNSKGQLANYVVLTGTLPGTPSATTVLSYDAQNRLIRAENKDFIRVDYEYDGNGRIRLAKSYRDPSGTGAFDALNEQFEFGYDGNLFPIRITNTVSNVFPTPVRTTLFAYSNGNVVRVDVSSSDSNEPPSSSVIQYDDKANPYFGLITGDRPDARTFSRNNAIRSGETLVYDSKGLLTSLNVVSTNPRFNSQTTYEYEAY